MSRPSEAERLVSELRSEQTPRRKTTKLTPSNKSFQTTLMKQAIIKSGRDLNDPGTVEQFFFEGESMLVIDLSGGE